MAYPSEVQERIDFLSQYKENDNLKLCHIMHLYPGEIAFPNGYYDSCFFDLICFNTETMEKRVIKNRDGLDLHNSSVKMHSIRIFADGSTMVKFEKPVRFIVSQSMTIYET